MTGRPAAEPVPVLLLAQQLTEGGSERQLASIARSLDRDLFEPHVGVFRPGGFRVEELLSAGVNVEYFGFRSFGSPQVLRAAWEMSRFLRRRRIRLVHSFDTPANVFAVPVARACRTNVVLSSQRAFRQLSPVPYRRLLRLTDHLADAIVVNCRAIQRHLAADYGVREHKLRLCYNGIDTEQFSPGLQPRPCELAGPAAVIGVVCSLRREKGLPVLLNAFARVRRSQPAIRLLIVGSGPILPELESLRDRLELAESCVFKPATADVAAWLRALDIFVLPSLSEAFSNSLMEAMACGCAVVASDVGGNPELVEHGRTGLIFKTGDPEDLASRLSFLLEHERERREMAEAGCRFIRGNFSLTSAARNMEAIYQDLLGAPGAR